MFSYSSWGYCRSDTSDGLTPLIGHKTVGMVSWPDWAGLGRTGPDWAGLGRTGPDWAGHGRTGFLEADSTNFLCVSIEAWVRKIPWRRKWQPSPVFLPGKSHGRRSLANYSPWVTKSRTRLSDFFHLHRSVGEIWLVSMSPVPGVRMAKHKSWYIMII